MSRKYWNPDPPSRHHLPFDRPFDKPFDKLTVLSKVEGLMALRKAEGPFDRLTAMRSMADAVNYESQAYPLIR